MTPLSKNIKKHRLEKGFTQEALASLLGVSAQAVSKWETSDTYPDAALLLPLAEALGVSLDTLFDSAGVSTADVSQRIGRLLASAPAEERIALALTLCWQIQRGLVLDGTDDLPYLPKEKEKRGRASYFLGDHGFTLISDGKEPFFSLFPEPEDGFGHFLEDADALKEIFSLLSEEDTLRALFYLLEQNPGYIFEGEVLGRACSIEDDRLNAVLDGLLRLKAVEARPLCINGESRTLYYAIQSHSLLALFLVAKQLCYRGAYRLRMHERTRPLLRYRKNMQTDEEAKRREKSE